MTQKEQELVKRLRKQVKHEKEQHALWFHRWQEAKNLVLDFKHKLEIEETKVKAFEHTPGAMLYEIMQGVAGVAHASAEIATTRIRKGEG